MVVGKGTVAFSRRFQSVFLGVRVEKRQWGKQLVVPLEQRRQAAQEVTICRLEDFRLSPEAGKE